MEMRTEKPHENISSHGLLAIAETRTNRTIWKYLAELLKPNRDSDSVVKTFAAKRVNPKFFGLRYPGEVGVKWMMF